MVASLVTNHVALVDGFATYLAQGVGCRRLIERTPGKKACQLIIESDPALAWRVAGGEAGIRHRLDEQCDGPAVALWQLHNTPAGQLEGVLDTVARSMAQAPLAVLTIHESASETLSPSARLAERLATHDLWPTCIGYTGPGDAAVVAVVEHAGWAGTPPPSSFKVLAIMPVFNEADILAHTLGYLIDQGLEVYVLDNWSTDDSPNIARAWLGRGVVGVERFPAQGADGTYDLHRLLARVEEIALENPAAWYVLHDADERRESPWPGLRLREAFWRVDQRGFNCIDHLTLNFWPTNAAAYDQRVDIDRQLRYFEFSHHAGHFHQRRGWRAGGQRVDLASTAGHDVTFAGRRVEPFKFLLKHFPVRSQAHGERKVLRERVPRFAAAERAAGWHAQYDEVAEQSFVRSPADLVLFDAATFHERYVVERLSGLGVFEQPPDWATPMRDQ